MKPACPLRPRTDAARKRMQSATSSARRPITEICPVRQEVEGGSDLGSAGCTRRCPRALQPTGGTVDYTRPLERSPDVVSRLSRRMLREDRLRLRLWNGGMNGECGFRRGWRRQQPSPDGMSKSEPGVAMQNTGCNL